MTAATAERRPRVKAPMPRVVLRDDGGKGWTVFDACHTARRFAGFEAALASAHDTAATQRANLEIWQDGQYVCSLTSPETAASASAATGTSAFPRAERYANRAARAVLTVAGPLFWVALMVLALAACFGWRLLFL